MIASAEVPIPVTREEVARALLVLDERDHAALGQLDANPDMTFSLIRPLTNPNPQSLRRMQHDIGALMCGNMANCVSAGTKKPEYLGATYVDGEPDAMPIHFGQRKVNKTLLALKICSALPKTVMQPLTAKVDKISTNNSAHMLRLFWLGMATQTGVEEMRAASDTVYSVYGTGSVEPSPRLPVRLAYMLKMKHSFFNSVSMARRTRATIPQGSTLEFERLRLFVHEPGESPYNRLQR